MQVPLSIFWFIVNYKIKKWNGTKRIVISILIMQYSFNGTEIPLLTPLIIKGEIT